MAGKEKIEIVAELKDLVSSHIKDINAQIDRMDSKLSSVGSKGLGGGGSSGIMGQVLGANLLTGAISRAAGAVYDFGAESIQAYGKQEQFLTSLKTMFHGNTKEAETLNGQLQNFAKTTPFELTEIQDATKMMIAYGSTSGGVVNEMRMLGDVSSGVGSSLSEVGYLYGTLRTQGRAFSKDIYQFTGRGIPIVKELAKQFGVTDSQVMKLVEDGKVGFKEVEKAFKSMTSEGGQFFGMMNEQSKTLLGSWSNLEDAAGQLKANVGEVFADLAKDIVGSMTTGLNEVVERLKDHNKTVSVLKKAGLEDSKWMQFAQAGSTMMTGRTGGNDLLSQRLGEQITAADTEAKMHLTKSTFAKTLSKLSKDYMDDSLLSQTNDEIKVDPKKYAQERALILDAMATLDQSLISLKTEKDKEKMAGVEPKKLETLAKQNRATQTIVNIENLVREYSNVFQNDKAGFDMSMTKMMEAVSKVLTGAVNDISVLGQN